MDSSSGGDTDTSSTDLTDTSDLDKFFWECDKDGTGIVKSSVLIVHIINTLDSSQLDRNVYQNELSIVQDIFHPNKDDDDLDINTFRQRMIDCINCLNGRNENAHLGQCSGSSFGSVFRDSVPLRRVSPYSAKSAVPSPRKALFKSHAEYLADINFPETDGFLKSEKELLESADSHENLKFQIKKLGEENVELKENLDEQEKQFSELSQKLERTQRDLRRQQSLLDQLNEVSEENEKSKGQITALTEARSSLEKDNKQLMKSIALLETEQEELQSKFIGVSSKLEELQREKEMLEDDIKIAQMEVERLAAERSTENEMASQQLMDIGSNLKEQKQLCETLKSEKIDLKLQLSTTQLQLQSMLNQTGVYDVNSSVHLTPEELSVEEEDDEIDFGPVFLAGQTSTPFKVDSICAEISKSIREEPLLPSPLCEKELEDLSEFDATRCIIDEVENCIRVFDMVTKMNRKFVDEAQQQESRKRTNLLKECLTSLKDNVRENQETLSQLRSTAKNLRENLEKEKLHSTDLNKQVGLLQCKRDEFEEKIMDLELEKDEMNSIKSGLEQKLKEVQRAKEEISDLYHLSQDERKSVEKHLATLNKDFCELQTTSSELKDELKRSQSQQESGIRELWTLISKENAMQGSDHFLTEDGDFKTKAIKQIAEEIELLRFQLRKSQDDLDALQKKVTPNLTLRLHPGSGDAAPQQYHAGSPLVEALTLESWDAINNTKTNLTTRANVHRNGTASDENILDCDYNIAYTFKHSQKESHSNLIRTDSSSCPDFDELENDFSQQKRGKARKAALKLKANRFPSIGSKRYTPVFSSNGSSTSGGTGAANCGSNPVPSNLKKKKNVYFEDNIQSTESLSSCDEFTTRMTGLVRYRAESYEQAISYGANASCESHNAPASNTLSPRSRSQSFKKAVESGTSGDSGISNDILNSNDHLDIDDEHYTTFANHSQRLSTHRGGSNILRPSKFRSGVYDRSNVHLPANDDSAQPDVHVVVDSNFDSRRRHYPDLARQQNVHEGTDNLYAQGDTTAANYIDRLDLRNYGDLEVTRTSRSNQRGIYGSRLIDTSAYGAARDDRSVSPATKRRLSILNEESVSEMNVEVHSPPPPIPPPPKPRIVLPPPVPPPPASNYPVPPPRRRGRSPRPPRKDAKIRTHDSSSPKHIKDCTNRHNKVLLTDHPRGSEHTHLRAVSPFELDVDRASDYGSDFENGSSNRNGQEARHHVIAYHKTASPSMLHPDIMGQFHDPVFAKVRPDGTPSVQELTAKLSEMAIEASPVGMGNGASTRVCSLQPPSYTPPPPYKQAVQSRSRDASPRGEKQASLVSGGRGQPSAFTQPLSSATHAHNEPESSSHCLHQQTALNQAPAPYHLPLGNRQPVSETSGIHMDRLENRSGNSGNCQNGTDLEVSEAGREDVSFKHTRGSISEIKCSRVREKNGYSNETTSNGSYNGCDPCVSEIGNEIHTRGNQRHQEHLSSSVSQTVSGYTDPDKNHLRVNCKTGTTDIGITKNKGLHYESAPVENNNMASVGGDISDNFIKDDAKHISAQSSCTNKDQQSSSMDSLNFDGSRQSGDTVSKSRENRQENVINPLLRIDMNFPRKPEVIHNTKPIDGKQNEESQNDVQPLIELNRSTSFDESRGQQCDRLGSDGNSLSDPQTSSRITDTVNLEKNKKEEDLAKTTADDSLDIKQEILKGLEKSKESPSKVSFKNSSELAKLREENLAKKKLNKPSGMPELSENMEMDSADSKRTRDSNISEQTPQTLTNGVDDKMALNGQQHPVDDLDKNEASVICETQVYPSLSKNILKKFGLHRDISEQESDYVTETDEKEIEDKFTNVSLAFKTDKLTLDQRLVVHKRARDTIEQNIECELKGLKQSIHTLSPVCNDVKSRELYCLIEKHIEILEHSHGRLASRAEIHGAVQQEVRISRAIDVMVRHVENLKRMYEREHQELEETKRLLQENKLIGDQGGLPKGFNLAGGGPSAKALLKNWVANKKGTRRRASLAVLPRVPASSLNLITPSRELDKSKLQNMLDSTTTSFSSALRRASSTFRRASIAVSATTPSTPQPAPPPVLHDRTSHLSLSSPSLFNTPKASFSRMNSQASSISSDDAATPRHSLNTAIPEDDDIMEEVPMRYPADGTVKPDIMGDPTAPDSSTLTPRDSHPVTPDSSTLTPRDAHPTSDTNTEKSESVDKGPDIESSKEQNKDCSENKRDFCQENVSNNNSNNKKVTIEDSMNNNNEVSNTDLEDRKAKERARRAIANQTIITDDDPEDQTEEQSWRSAPRVSEENMGEHMLLFQERLRDLIERQDTVEDDEDSEDALMERLWRRVPDTKTVKRNLSYALSGLVMFMGVVCLVMSILPSSLASDKPLLRQWSSEDYILWPFLTVKRFNNGVF